MVAAHTKLKPSMKRITQWVWMLAIVLLAACTKNNESSTGQPVHKDVAFTQQYSIKYNVEQKDVVLKKVTTDRNDVIQVYSSGGLLKTYAGEFLYPGTLV